MVSRTMGGGLGLIGDWDLGEDGWKDGMDANLLKLSTLVQGGAVALVDATPGSPVEGAVYLFSAAHPTNANAVAVYDEATWTFYAPNAGWLVYDNGAAVYRSFTGTEWAELETGGGDGVEEAPIDDVGYVRKNGGWEPESEGGGGGGAATGEVGAHRYWLLKDWTYTQGAADPVLGGAALALRETVGGAAIAVSSVTATDTLSGYPASNLTDGNAATFWVAQYSSNPSLVVDLGSAKNVRQIAWTGRPDGTYWNQSPRGFNLFFSDDGATWNLAGPVLLPVMTGAGQTTVGTVPLTIVGSGDISVTKEVADAATNLLAEDVSKYLRFTSATAKTLTVQPNSTAPQEVNSEWHIRNAAATGALTLIAGSGVTISAPANGSLVLPVGATATLKCVGADTYDLVGQTVGSNVVPVAQGGTGGSTAAEARTNLGMGDYTNAIPGPSTIQAFQNSDSATAVGTISVRRSRGTLAAPTAVQNGDYIGGLYLYGHDGANYIASGAIRAVALENFTTAARGTELRFSATAIGSAARTENLKLRAGSLSPLTDGLIDFGTSTERINNLYFINATMGGAGTGNRLFTIDAQSGYTAYLELMTGGSRYWLFGRQSNNNFSCMSYNGTGSSVGSAFTCFPASLTVTFGGTVRPSIDNTNPLGDASYRWTVVYAATGTINTSDEREKQDIREPYEQLLDAWAGVNWKAFRWKDAVEAKGADARWHYGLIAQQVRDAIDSALGEGKAVRLGLVCYDEWEATEAEYDEDGNEIVPARASGNRWGLRYEECFAVEAAYQRRRMDRIEAAVAALTGGAS